MLSFVLSTPLALISQVFQSQVKKLLNRNLNQIGLGNQKGELSYPVMIARVQQEEERLLFFPGKDSASEKPWTLCSLECFPTVHSQRL